MDFLSECHAGDYSGVRGGCQTRDRSHDASCRMQEAGCKNWLCSVIPSAARNLSHARSRPLASGVTQWPPWSQIHPASVVSSRTIGQHQHFGRRHVSNLDVGAASGVTLHRQTRPDRMRACVSLRVSSLSRVQDDRHRTAGWIKSPINQNVGAAFICAMRVKDAQRFFVIEDARPSYDLARPVHVKGLTQERDGSQVLSPIAQDRIRLAECCECGDAEVRWTVIVKAMASGCAERAESWQVCVHVAGWRLQSITTTLMRMFRTEHCLAQVAVRVAPIRKPAPFGRLRPGKSLLRPIVDARNAQRKELHSDTRSYLVIGRGLARKAQLAAKDVIVVIQNRNVPVAQVAV